MKRCVFLDRDGVINKVIFRGVKSFPPPTLEEFQYLPFVEEGVRQLKAMDFLVIVATNQPDILGHPAREKTTSEIHRCLFSDLGVNDIYVCYHQEMDNCNCKKPKAGMLLSASEKWNIDLSRSFMVGDRWSDVLCGQAAGCKTFLIGDGYPFEAPPRERFRPEWRVSSLTDVAEIIMQLNN